jgi:hypothetical protein
LGGGEFSAHLILLVPITNLIPLVLDPSLVPPISTPNSIPHVPTPHSVSIIGLIPWVPIDFLVLLPMHCLFLVATPIQLLI